MSCLLSQIYLTLSVSICPYHPLLLAGLPNYILCPNGAIENNFLLVCENIHVHVKGSKGYHCLCDFQQCPTCLVRLIWMI